MADQDIDRSEEATPYKLQKARERAQTARSADAVAATTFLAAVSYLAWQGEEAMNGLLGVTRAALEQAVHRAATGSAAWPLAADVAQRIALLLLPFFLLLPLAAWVGSVAQTGIVFSLAPLHADFQRINPATGLKRILSPRTLFDGLRGCVKLAVLGGVAWVALSALVPQFHLLAALSPAVFLHNALGDLTSLGWKMAAALLLIAAADVTFTRREFQKRMRMSRRELKDEYRSREGDPRIRARLRELRRELLRRSRSLQATKTADVVLTNPTHYAVALRYVHGEMDAPRVVAKGAGQLAAAMREIAARHRIVVVQNPPLARRLFREVALDDSLPRSFHAEVARIIVWVLALRQNRTAGGAAT